MRVTLCICFFQSYINSVEKRKRGQFRLGVKRNNYCANRQNQIAHISATVRARTFIFWYVVEESILGKKWLWFAVWSFPSFFLFFFSRRPENGEVWKWAWEVVLRWPRAAFGRPRSPPDDFPRPFLYFSVFRSSGKEWMTLSSYWCGSDLSSSWLCINRFVKASVESSMCIKWLDRY